jgi:ribonucleoside-diphosphate reductase alpha chain
MEIIKRNGTKVKFVASKLQTRVEKTAKGLKVDAHTILLDVFKGIADNMTTSEIDNLISEVAAGYTTKHYDYSLFAARIIDTRIQKDVPEFFEASKILMEDGIIPSEQYAKYEKFRNVIEAELVNPEQPVLDYLGIKTFSEVYALCDKQGDILETPMNYRIRLSTFFSETEEDFVENVLALKSGYSPPTPTMCNAGTTENQLASCQLHYLKDDSTDGLMDTFKDLAHSSRNKAGIGLAAYNQRAKASKSSKGWGAAGQVQAIKIANEIMKFFDQGGKRPGSTAWYTTPWHLDIFDFLKARKVTTHESLAARDMFYGIWTDDEFMKRVENKDFWYLFCPNELKKAGLDFINKFGDDFSVEYHKAIDLFEQGILPGEKILAEDLWTEIFVCQVETGMPYMGFKDTVNKFNSQSNLGTIKSSNLCHEIVQYTDPETVAVCVLSSLVVSHFVDASGNILYDKLERTLNVIVRNLNISIDKNRYTTKEARKGSMQQRAIGVGIQGLSDIFYKLEIEYESPEAIALVSKLEEAIHYYTIKGSMEYSKKVGKRLFEEETIYPIETGVFQWEKYGVETHLNWESLRQDILTYGVANSMFNAQMPTATSAQMHSSTESYETLTNNIYVRRLKIGEVTVINRFLVRAFEKLGIWGEALSDDLILAGGSVQDLNIYDYLDIPTKEQKAKFEKIQSIFKTTWEVSQKTRTNICIAMQPFIDQAISMNVFYKDPTISRWSSALFYAWRNNLKTGNYYCRTYKETGNKSLGISKKDSFAEMINKSRNSDPEDCEMCSS